MDPVSAPSLTVEVVGMTAVGKTTLVNKLEMTPQAFNERNKKAKEAFQKNKLITPGFYTPTCRTETHRAPIRMAEGLSTPPIRPLHPSLPEGFNIAANSLNTSLQSDLNMSHNQTMAEREDREVSPPECPPSFTVCIADTPGLDRGEFSLSNNTHSSLPDMCMYVCAYTMRESLEMIEGLLEGVRQGGTDDLLPGTSSGITSSILLVTHGSCLQRAFCDREAIAVADRYGLLFIECDLIEESGMQILGALIECHKKKEEKLAHSGDVLSNRGLNEIL